MVAATSAWTPRDGAPAQNGATAAHGDAPRWILKRNCCLTPRQLLRVYAVMCAVSFGIALAFWAMGARLVLPFAWIEMVGLGLALWVYARHALDRESIAIERGQVHVEQEVAGRVTHVTFEASRVRVSQSGGAQALVELTGPGLEVAVGRHLRPACRARLADELRAALRGPHGQG